ncbi:B9 domain-containing protein 2 isoform X2 [Drosophila suzukii]|uniref:B9 domain-containing protein 2 n=1 Tax=Drosophila suzukii TaxID=28584 RepID=A0ABM4TY70_DROSZ|nr:B9 domain-containing protein 2 isoform X1 [Drosophila suzukii]
MADFHIIGQIIKAVHFAEPHLYCKWSLQSGNAWRLVQGEVKGESHVAAHRLQNCADFVQTLDIHLSAGSVQGWPRLLVEVYAIDVLKQSWPVGYGFLHIPSTPGTHRMDISTWKVAPNGLWQSLRELFGGGGAALSKNDIIYSGVERQNFSEKALSTIDLR